MALGLLYLETRAVLGESGLLFLGAKGSQADFAELV